MAEPNRKLRWGLLSTARINRRLIDAVRAAPRSEVFGVASRSLDAASAFADAHGIPCAYATYEDLVADPDIDVVYNPLPNRLHAPWTVRALKAGKHVLCEKPMALSIVQGQIMGRAAEKAGRVLAEAFMYRHHPRTAEVRDLVRNGAIGRLRRIHGAFTFRFDRDGNWRWDPDEGGGSLWDVGCYPVSFARYVTGAEPLHVWAEQHKAESGVDDALTGFLRFPDDVLATFDCGFDAAFRSEMTFVGTEGVLHVPMAFRPEGRMPLVLERDGQREERFVEGPTPLFLGEVLDMEAAILDGRPPAVPVADSLGTIATLVAILHAASTGHVAVPESV